MGGLELVLFGTIFAVVLGKMRKPADVAPGDLFVGPVDDTAGTGISGEGFALTGTLEKYADLIYAESQRHDLDPYLVAAIIETESGGDPNAENASGAEDSIGLMQVNTKAHPEYDPVKLRDPAYNIWAGCTILAASFAFMRTHGIDDVGVAPAAVAGYNAGPAMGAKGWREGNADKYTNRGRYGATVARYYETFTGYAPW